MSCSYNVNPWVPVLIGGLAGMLSSVGYGKIAEFLEASFLDQLQLKILAIASAFPKWHFFACNYKYTFEVTANDFTSKFTQNFLTEPRDDGQCRSSSTSRNPRSFWSCCSWNRCYRYNQQPVSTLTNNHCLLLYFTSFFLEKYSKESVLI